MATSFLRLRQICLVSRDLPRAIDDIQSIFGVSLCHRDDAVGKYGLENALFPFGHAFLEVVAPTRDGTAAGRFLDRSGGVGGYMAIFNCDDVERRKGHAERLGIAIAHVMSYETFYGIQLHPRDCRAAMIEFDRTEGGDALDGPYHPAGHDWHSHIKTDVTRGIAYIEIESPTPDDIAAHWSAITEIPLTDNLKLPTPLIDIRFVQGGPRETLRALHLDVVDPDKVTQAAQAHGYTVTGRTIELCGVRFSY
jgi:hypothetical protein